MFQSKLKKSLIGAGKNDNKNFWINILRSTKQNFLKN